MPGPDFFQTVMGHRFIEGTIPRLTKAVERLADSMERAEKGVMPDPTARHPEPVAHHWVVTTKGGETIDLEFTSYAKDHTPELAAAAFTALLQSIASIERVNQADPAERE